MNKLVKREIRKIVKRNGSHFGIVKRLITEQFDVDFNDYAEFTNQCIDKKLKNVETKIRAKVIDGYKYLLIFKNLGFQKVNCHYFGELDKQKYAALRIYFNHNEKRIDTLEISQAIGLILKNKNDIKNFIIQTGINEKDVERYVDISTFDWDSFNKNTEAFSGQIDLFKK